MTYLSGISYGSDEISSNNYLDDLMMFEDNDDESEKHYSGYDYHPQGGMYKPPLPRQPPPREEYTTPVRKLYDLWRLKANSKQREGFIMDDSHFWMIAIFLIFVMLIYFIGMYKITRSVSNEITKCNEFLAFLATIKDAAKNQPAQTAPVTAST